MSEKLLPDRGVISVTPELNKPRGAGRRSSTGSTTAKDSISRTSTDEKKLPNYLRASTNSCHDLCKYGRRHAVEEKGKKPIQHRLGNNRLLGSDHLQPKVLSHGERSKRPLIKLKSPSLWKIEISNKLNSFKKKSPSPAKGSNLVEEPVNVELRTSSPTWKDIVPYEVPDRATSPQIEQLPVNNLIFDDDDGKRRQVIHLKTPLHPETSDEKPILEQMNVSSNKQILAYEGGKQKMESPFKKAISSLKPKPARQLLMEKHTASVKSKVVKETPKDKPSTSAKHQIVKKMTSASRKYVDLPAKPVIFLKNTTLKGKPSFPHIPTGSTNVQRSKENKIGKNIKSETVAKIREEKAMPPSRPSLSTESPVDDLLSLKKSGNTHDSDYNDEKTLYVIEPEAQYFEQKSHDYCSSQPPSSDKESESAFSESSELLSEDEGAESFTKDEPSTGENIRLRRSATSHPEDESLTTHELKFKRGQVIELPSDTNGPRKLRFRRGRVIGEHCSDGQLRRRSFRRRTGNAVTSTTNLETHIVVLRHQDAEEKKDTQGLFNNVIEQTASKLVETRKSKVKALVGAFETVISLQDGKPTS